MSRAFCILFSAIVVFAVVGPAQAQPVWPVKPVRLINAGTPGGPADTALRVFCEFMGPSMKQPCIVDSRAGANGIAAMEAFARSPADGYVLGVGSVNPLAINPHLYKKLPYDPFRDFTPLGFIIDLAPFFVSVTPKIPARNLAELIAYAKTQPGKLSFGATTPITGMAGDWINKAAGIDVLHVNYNTAGQLMQGALSGDVQIVYNSLSTIRGALKTGDLIPIAVSSSNRFAAFPEVAAVGETLKGFQADGWLALFGPSGFPKELVPLINREIDKVVTSKGFREKMSPFAWNNENGASTPEALAEKIRAEYELWGRVIREIGIKPQ